MTVPERILMGSGPSNVPPSVLEALARPITGHLDPDFLATLDEVADLLREIFHTRNRMTFAVSGTGSAGMEAAFVNVLEPGDEAIVCINGVFGGRFADIAGRCGAKVVQIEAPWGEPISDADVAQALEDHPDAKVFALVHAETSTGVAQPIDAISASVADHGALFVLDAVTSLSGMPVDVDGWGVDVCYAGTQKCLSVPPGLAPITFSERAMETVAARSTPVQSWYLDVTMLAKYWGEERVYHHTPPVAMLVALHTGLGLVLEEGLEERWARHREVASVLKAGLSERGFGYVAADDVQLPMLHCVRLPQGAEVAATRGRLLREFGIDVSTGIGPFSADCLRIGVMGYSATERNVRTLLAALDALLAG